MDQFIEITEVFLKNLNSSLIERDQWIDAFEILIDKMMDYRTDRGVDVEFGRLLSMLEVLVHAMKIAQDVDEDMIRVYEMDRLKKFKSNLLKEGNNQECQNLKMIQKPNGTIGSN